jgi:hypothetical protein
MATSRYGENLLLDFPFCPGFQAGGNRKAGAEIWMIFRQPGCLGETL